MIRKAIIVVFLLIGLATGVAWATSYDDLYSFLPSDYYTYRLNPRECLGISSLHGWLRIGAIRCTKPSNVPTTDVFDVWMLVATRSMLRPFDQPSGFEDTDTYLFGMVRTLSRRCGTQHIASVAVPHLFACTVFLTYPTIAFLRGPLRCWRRPRKGLCTRCGYNLEGNVSGVCPECGEAR